MNTKNSSMILGFLLFLVPALIAQDMVERKIDVHTKEWRDAQTPDQIIQYFKDGNQDFVNRTWKAWDFLYEQKHTAEGQHPMAAILSCIDSRAPAEITFNMGIGDLFNARVAGNFVNKDIAGSLEYACKVAGAKVIFVMGHTGCGAVKSACDDVELGNITHLLSNIKPAINAVETNEGEERNSSNKEFVYNVERKNVVVTIEKMREMSPILKEMEDSGAIKIVGCIYDIKTGEVEFFE